MPELSILNFLDAGGNLALFALVYIMWKFDRRLVILEILIKNLQKKLEVGEGR